MLLNTPTCDFGWKAPDFTLQDPNGLVYSLEDYIGDKALLVAFICNHCPYVKAIAQRLANDTALLMDEGINVLAIMSNDYEYVPEDSPENMLKFAKANEFKFPYLVDMNQDVGRAYKAVCTPDFFGFNWNGELQYRGRLDDMRSGGDPSQRVPELLNAMRQVSQLGVGPQKQVPSMGCSIKWR